MVENRLKGEKLYLTDFDNICLDNHTSMINSLLDGSTFSSKYNSYDTSKGDIVTFICFNIESIVKKNSLIIKNIKYQDNLVFTYDKTNNIVLIKGLPKYGDEKNKILIFTSDILTIILEKLKKYVEADKIIIEFEGIFQKFAIDNNLKELLPQIEQNINYKRMNFIYEQMRLEEERIKNEVLAEKRRKDKEDAKKERVIAQKSIIYGIDRRDYENYLDYLNAVNKRIVEVCDYKIKNIIRHIEANKKKYIELLRKNDETHEALEEILYSISSDREYNCSCGYKEVSEYCYVKVYDAIKSRIENINTELEITNEILDIYYEEVYQFDSDIYNEDLYNEENLIFLLTKIRNYRMWAEYRYDGNERIKLPNADDMYNYILGVDYYCGKWRTDCEEIMNYKNPIFQRSEIIKEDFKKCVDLLFQIASLKRQLIFYENLKANPDDSLLNFQSNSDAWNSILNFPYWLRLGRDTQKSVDDRKEKFNLLMIKPGVIDINLNRIRIFTRNNGQEFGHTKMERQEYLQKVMQRDSNYLSCDRLMITIPKSLEFNSIIKLIDYAHNHGCQVQFVCETPDIAAIIKGILVDKALTAYKQVSIIENEIYDHRHDTSYINYKKLRNNYFINRCFICVDPEYFSNFMLDSPTNKNYWHRYDYTGNYKYRKKNPASLDYEIDRAIYENTHDGVIDYERINKQLLGSYLSEEPEVEPINISLGDFIEGKDYSMLSKWFPECEDLDRNDKVEYVDNKFPNRLDRYTRSKLYYSEYTKYDEEKDIRNEGEVYKIIKKYSRMI